MPYKAFSKNSCLSSSSVEPQDPPIASTSSGIPVWLATLSLAGSKRATFLNADPSTNSAARGASCSKCSTGHMAARNRNFWTYSWTFVVPAMNFGMLCHGGWRVKLEGVPPFAKSGSSAGTGIDDMSKTVASFGGPWSTTLTVISLELQAAPLPVWRAGTSHTGNFAEVPTKIGSTRLNWTRSDDHRNER